MTKMLAIDPGLRAVAVAYFENSELKDIVWVRNPEQTARDFQAWYEMTMAVAEVVMDEKGWAPVDVLVIERQQVYKSYEARIDPDNIIQLTGVAGGLNVFLESTHRFGYLPRQWKSNKKKDDFTKFILSKMSDDERKLFDGVTGRKLSDCVDAAGIGMYHLGRLKA